VNTLKHVQSYLEAEKDSAGEEYVITHIAVENVVPQGVPVAT